MSTSQPSESAKSSDSDLGVLTIYTKLPGYPWGDQRHLDLNTWTWLPCLVVPVLGVLRLYAPPHPIKWLLDCIGAVLGVKGEFSVSEDNLDIIDNQYPLSPNHSMHLYYHVSQDELPHMLPVDPHLLAARLKSVDVPILNARDPGFRPTIRNRDASGLGASTGPRVLPTCQAAHLVPHGKGNTYIHNLTLGRSQGIAGPDVVSSIDDVRNGVFLDPSMHSLFGTSFALLETPDDVAVGNASGPAPMPATTMTLTPHYFDSSDSSEVFGDPIHIQGPNFPSRIFLDVIYGSVVLRHFGVEATISHFDRIWGQKYYPGGGPMSNLEAETTRLHEEDAKRTAIKAQQNQEREDRLKRRRRNREERS